MSGLRGSANYIWFESDVLGQGATGAVYKARHKRTGEVFAVKTFNQMGQMRPLEVQMREFQVLQKVNQENIVKLLGIEEDTLSNNKVIIMELCTGGSLFNVLEEPRNSFGVSEKDFFCVLKDVASGLKHLREMGIVHRDIKPGNIMLFHGEDGRQIYKLTDFGAARELEEEEQFMSLYGTEEYLYPDMYARAVLRRPSDKRFDASVDLWSLGVTLYHVATGHLPFRPFGGRSNKHTMYQMTGSKETGVISGIQHEAGGPIEYSRELPNTSPLSEGARLIVTPLLAGLMECKEDRMWTFDQFFEEVNRIMKKLTIYVFDTYDSVLLHVFLDPTDRMVQFQEAIAKQTNIPANHQELLLDRRYLSDSVTPMCEARDFPSTTTKDPLFLYYMPASQETGEFPALKPPQIPKCPITSAQTMNLQADYTQSKTTSGILHHIKRKMDDYHSNQKLTALAAKVFLFLVVNNIVRLQHYIHQFSALVDETQKRIKWFQVQHDRNTAILGAMVTVENQNITNQQVDTFRQDGEKAIREVSQRLHTVYLDTQDSRRQIDEFYTRIVTEQELAWEHITKPQCVDTDKCFAKINFLLEELDITVKNFRSDKKKRGLSHNEEQIHKFERHKVKTNCDKATQILNKTCWDREKNVFKKFADWFKWSSKINYKLKGIEDNMAVITKAQADISQKMDVSQSKNLEQLEALQSHIKRPSSSTNGNRDLTNGTVSRGIEQDYVLFDKEDVPSTTSIQSQLLSQRSTNRKSSLRSLRGQIVNLKSDTDDIQRWLNKNTGLLQEIKTIVDDS